VTGIIYITLELGTRMHKIYSKNQVILVQNSWILVHDSWIWTSEIRVCLLCVSVCVNVSSYAGTLLRDMTHSYVILLIHTHDMTHLYVWYDAFICLTWLI